MSTDKGLPDYSQWSNEELVGRITELESQLKDQAAKCISPPKLSKLNNPHVNREFDPAKYSTRLIALKFAYLGQRYNGLEYHANNPTPLPTIEEELWKALRKAHMVFPTPNPALKDDEPNWEGCDYSKAGRTDRGVSAFGQVVGIRVRSDRPLSKAQNSSGEQAAPISAESPPSDELELAAPSLEPSFSMKSRPATPSSIISWDEPTLAFDPIQDELPYCQILNRILPSDIRILAWCPFPPLDFSARFSCKERRYKYFFTQPAFSPSVGGAGLVDVLPKQGGGKMREGYLNIAAMREGAQKFIGLHDFRNFCKLDASKQIENFERRIFHADIEEINLADGPASYINRPSFQQYEIPTTQHPPAPQSEKKAIKAPKLYAFTLHGSAFLWHQVRHMVAVLFLIGQGLEDPSIVSSLLDIEKYPRKPTYEMADDAPLVLWDCIFPREGSGSREDALEWKYVGSDQHRDGNNRKDAKYGIGGLIPELWSQWRRRKMDEILAGMLLNKAVEQGGSQSSLSTTAADSNLATHGDNNIPLNPSQPSLPPHSQLNAPKHSQKLFQGSPTIRYVGRYIPVSQKPLMEDPKTVNERFAKKKGYVVDEVRKETGWRDVGFVAGEEQTGTRAKLVSAEVREGVRAA